MNNSHCEYCRRSIPSYKIVHVFMSMLFCQELCRENFIAYDPRGKIDIYGNRIDVPIKLNV